MDNSQAAEQVKSISVQAVLETFRTTRGFPWWATLILSDVAVRAAIFPFYVLVLGELDVNEGNFRLYKAALGVQYRGHIYDHKRHLNVMLLGRQSVRAVIKKYNTRPIQTVIGAFAYIPIFIVWRTVLVICTYMLPALEALSTFSSLEVSARTKSGFWTELLRAGQYGTILAVPFLANLPRGVLFNWLGSSWLSMAQSIVMKNNNVRRRMDSNPES
ncbi:unnamed protein product [Peronospora belbahrii]|uniref:Uncharacterized protein n=1 Tax=Peronospora belbahrii TaxID=622444 RepID=A0AAU9LBF0_9STRA|nr:unnamed protein product [Peronospora belbahrii]CAH0481915.1 unnamed protein product [Peronospora belbahrii]CAH0514339.1 unnamed protein product [Peronospora belbahrii]